MFNRYYTSTLVYTMDAAAGTKWVTPDTLDVSKISVFASANSDKFERLRVLYKYSIDSEPRDLIITVPRLHEAYIKCKGVKRDLYTQGDRKIETNRYGAQFVLSADNLYHNALYNAFTLIIQKIQELTQCEISFPSSDLESSTILYTNLIHSNDGRMFSVAYTANEQLTITDCRSCITRPAFLLSLLKKSTTLIKVRIQVSQMYVHEAIKEFPLANMD